MVDVISKDAFAAMASFYRPRVGISSCLLGESVRWDAGHKRDPYVVDVLGAHVEWVPVCPEVEAGFGTPRETMNLVRRSGGGLRLMTTKTAVDVTAQLEAAAGSRVEALVAADLSGYILKKDSPSCGMERVRVYSKPGTPPERTGRGLFAAALMARLPNLPVEEEGRLSDMRLRENFIERVFAYGRVRALFASPWSMGDLVKFHTAHKMALLAHSTVAYRALGQLVAAARTRKREAVARDYETGFMRALSAMATPKRHANVLQHMMGYFKTRIDADAKAEMNALIEDHRAGRVPLVVPLTLIKHYVRRHPIPYLEGQTYLEPHPRELSLRNHV
jgi:uncharacterized protein YbgA (DUF1722 family)/uncharacterized protein YbbK (DUF523 family)